MAIIHGSHQATHLDAHALSDLSKEPTTNVGKGLGRGKISHKQAESAQKLMIKMTRFESFKADLDTAGISVKGRDVSQDLAQIDTFVEKGNPKKAYALITKLNKEYDAAFREGHRALRTKALRMLRDQCVMVKIYSKNDKQSMRFLRQRLGETRKDISKSSVGQLQKLMKAISEENKAHAVKLHRVQPDHRLALDPDNFSCNELTADIKAQYSEQYVASPIQLVKAKADDLQALANGGNQDAAEMLNVFSKDNKETLMDTTIKDLKALMDKLKGLLPDAFNEPKKADVSRSIDLG